MAEAMSKPVEGGREADSDVLDEETALAFQNQLVLHHATQTAKLNKKAFEYVFLYANEAAKRKAEMNPETIRSSWDVKVNGVPYSLKTQADSKISRRALYIQKLMEARWIRDCPGPAELAAKLKEKLEEHLKEYDKILVLRAFSVTDEQEPKPTKGKKSSGKADAVKDRKVEYELVEVPKTMLALMTQLSPESFPEKNEYGTSSVDVRDDEGVAYRVSLDGSVEKVRIFNLRIYGKNRCRIHGRWTIPLPLPDQDDDDDETSDA